MANQNDMLNLPPPLKEYVESTLVPRQDVLTKAAAVSGDPSSTLDVVLPDLDKLKDYLAKAKTAAAMIASIKASVSRFTQASRSCTCATLTALAREDAWGRKTLRWEA